MLRLRLILLSVLLFTGLVAGTVSALLTSSRSAPVSGSGAELAQLGSPPPTVPLVARLIATGIFPVVREPVIERAPQLGTDGDGLNNGASGLEAALLAQAEVQLPGVAALVRREQAWSIFVNGVEHRSEEISVGDVLYDGWVVEEIEAARFTLKRGAEVREIHVFTIESDA